MHFYNTLTRKKEEFAPLKAGHVSLYVCGPTVYDNPHIGHLRSAYIFDCLRRILEQEYAVLFVRNVTDVDDKIIQRAHQENRPIHEITEQYLGAYHDDLKIMGIKPPTHEPRATEEKHIQGMIRMIEKLIAKNMAYRDGANVYFNVKESTGYGALSNQRMDQMLDNWRGETGEGKKEALDFALWKASKDDEPSWDSPWGKGRPGWHIECSVMSTHFLGETFDIHGGGKDLLFPHHENERAQVLGCSDGEFAKVWMHHGLITTDSKKMSKSLGNFISLNEIRARYPVDVLKLFFLQSHYSQDADFTWEKCQGFYEALKSFALLFEKTGLTPADTAGDVTSDFDKHLLDDMNTPNALADLFEVLSQGNIALKAGDTIQAKGIAAWILMKARILGLFLAFDGSAERSSVLEDVIALRKKMREEKKYEVSDFIRTSLTDLGLHVEDQKGGDLQVYNKSLNDEKQAALRQLLEKAKAMF